MAHAATALLPPAVPAGPSTRHGKLEREVKFAVGDLDAVAARLHVLEDAGAVLLDTVQECNSVLDTVRQDLKARDERLRIREIAGQRGVQVTWKGPASVRHGVRRREEREFHADDRDACLALLSHLGLRPVRSYDKIRSSWRLGDVIICLDCLPCGTFVEIELLPEVSEVGETAALERAVALLGLQNAPRVQASYARLQQEWDARNGSR